MRPAGGRYRPQRVSLLLCVGPLFVLVSVGHFGLLQRNFRYFGYIAVVSFCLTLATFGYSSGIFATLRYFSLLFATFATLRYFSLLFATLRYF